VFTFKYKRRRHQGYHKTKIFPLQARHLDLESIDHLLAVSECKLTAGFADLHKSIGLYRSDGRLPYQQTSFSADSAFRLDL
jgi:hypothetical protein